MAGVTNAYWYLGRGSGIAALVLFTAVVVLGITTRAGRPALGMPRFALAAVHRSISLLALTFLAVHVVTLEVDPYAQLRLVDVVLPFGAAYRPLWEGLGALSLDLAAALIITSLMRARVPLRFWRAIHWAAYACWPAAVAHALGTGTDRRSLWMLAVVLSCAAAGAGAIAWRMLDRRFASPLPAEPTAPPANLAGLR